MSNKYVVKGIKKEQVMNSVVKIYLASDGKIEKVEDRWNGKLPEGAISDVSETSPPDSGGSDRGGWAWVVLHPLALTRLVVEKGSDVAWWSFCTFSWWSPFLVGRHFSMRPSDNVGGYRIRC